MIGSILSRIRRASDLIPKLFRLSGGMASQILSSVTNFGLTISLARNGSASEFGAAALALTFYTSTQLLMAAAINQPLTLLYHAEDQDNRRLLIDKALSLAIFLSVLCGCCVGLISLFPVGEIVHEYLIILAPALPLLLLLEWQRQMYFTEIKPYGAFSLDAAWFLGFLSMLTIFQISGRSSSIAAFEAWEITGVIVAVAGLIIRRSVPKFAHVWTYFRHSVTVSKNFVGEALITNLSNPVTVSVVTAKVGLAPMGGYRGAQTIMSPITILNSGLLVFVFPKMASLGTKESQKFRKYLNSYWAATIVLTAVLSCSTFVIPDRFGILILGDSWRETQQLLPMFAVFNVARSFVAGPQLRLMLPRPSIFFVAARAQDSCLLMVMTISGAYLAGVNGAVWGMALSRLLAFPGWYYLAGLRSTI